jgi:hypothetical protein
MRTHICKTVSRCFTALRQIRSIRRLVSTPVFQSLVTAPILCRLDYGNGTLVGLPAHLVGLPSHSLVYQHISLVYRHTRWSTNTSRWSTIILVGLPAHLVRRLQSVQNEAARLIFRLRRSDHISGALVSLHWLRVPERIKFKIAVLMYRVLQGAAPQYLRQFVRVANVASRQRLWSAVTERLIVPAFILSTIGCRSFYVAGANIWNSLPRNITSSSSLSVFKQRLKTYLFRFSFPDLSF